jgi:hypothetical protein
MVTVEVEIQTDPFLYFPLFWQVVETGYRMPAHITNVVRGGNDSMRPAGLPTGLAHAFQDEPAVVIHVIGMPLQWLRKNCGEPRRLLPADVPRRCSVVITAGCFRAINARAPLDLVEIEFQNALLAEYHFSHGDKGELCALAEDRAAGSEKQVLYQLLRKRGASANAPAFHIAFRGNFHRVPIESVMLIEARVFRRDYGVLEIGRDLPQRNEFVSLTIRPVMNPGLQAPLHVHGGGRRLDPPRSHKEQRSKRPKKRQSDEKTSYEESQREFPKRGLRVCIRIFGHISE